MGFRFFMLMRKHKCIILLEGHWYQKNINLKISANKMETSAHKAVMNTHRVPIVFIESDIITSVSVHFTEERLDFLS